MIWEWGNEYREVTNYSPPKSYRESTLEVIHGLALPLAKEISECFLKVHLGLEQQCLKNKHVFQKQSWALTTSCIFSKPGNIMDVWMRKEACLCHINYALSNYYRTLMNAKYFNTTEYQCVEFIFKWAVKGPP